VSRIGRTKLVRVIPCIWFPYSGKFKLGISLCSVPKFGTLGRTVDAIISMRTATRQIIEEVAVCHKTITVAILMFFHTFSFLYIWRKMRELCVCFTVLIYRWYTQLEKIRDKPNVGCGNAYIKTVRLSYLSRKNSQILKINKKHPQL